MPTSAPAAPDRRRPGRARLFILLLSAVPLCAALAASLTASSAAASSVAVFTVVNTNDGGPGSLRHAILDANANPGADSIHFNLPGAGVRTISPLTALPAVTGPTTVDATTQPGWAGTPVVELSGSQAPAGTGGLRFEGGASVLRGLAVGNFGQGAAVVLASDDNLVEDCHIGLAAAVVELRRNQRGVIVNGSNNTVGSNAAGAGNVIVGNGTGVTVSGANNKILGNYIGTNQLGDPTLANGVGVLLAAGADPSLVTNNVVGGTAPGSGNVISGNGTGVRVADTGSAVQGNFIGTDPTGLIDLGNGVGVHLQGRLAVVGGTAAGTRNVIAGSDVGVEFESSAADPQNRVLGNYIGTNAAGTQPIPNTFGVLVDGDGAIVGGVEPGAGNLISGNFRAIEGFTNHDAAVIRGNLIGTDPTGLLPLGNSSAISLDGANHIIGGPEPGARNVIGEGFTGIVLNGDGSVVRGNFIGVNAAGNGALPITLSGVEVHGSNNVIGGDGPGDGNLIAFNGTGVGVRGLPPGANNLVRGNRIFSNARLGIDLGNDFNVQPNDPLDADDGPNHFQNFPLITSVAPSGGGTRVQGTLASAPDTPFRVDFYSNRACDPSGFGEGATPFGSATVTTGADGLANFDVTLGAALAAGRVLTATATDPDSNTSEFSPCDAAGAAGSVEFEFLDYDVLEDVGSATITVVRRGGGLGAISVNYASSDGGARAGSDYTAVSGTLDFAPGETLKTFTVPVFEDGVDEFEEVVRLTLSTSDPEALGGRPVARLRIHDSDTPLFLRLDSGQRNVSQFTVPEGDAGTTPRPVTVLLSAATGRTVTADFSTRAGSATPGADFHHVSGSLTFAPGVVRRDVLVPIIGDTLDEQDETFGLVLTNVVNAGVNSPSQPVTIAEDDPRPDVSVDDAVVIEEAGAKAVFTVRLSAPSGLIVSVNFSTADGTATANEDYAPTSGAVFIGPGATTATVEIPVVADAVDEADETFFLNLDSASLGDVADAQAVATIREPNSSFSFSAAAYTVGEADRSAEITVNRAGDTSTAASIFYETVNQTASDRSDYTTAIGRLRFAPGETSKTFRVLIVDDVYVEGDETLGLLLSNQLGAGLVSPSAATLTITSNDTAPGQSPVKAESFNTAFFVRQHYLDFLGREPDEGGFQFWTSNIDICGPDDACRRARRVDTSAAFFLSIEFQETGYLVYRMYKAAFGDISPPSVPVPVRLREFLADTGEVRRDVQVGIGDWQAQLEANKRQFADEFVTRQRFVLAFQELSTPAAFVDRLNQNAGGPLSQAERDQLVADLAAGAKTRAQVLRAVAEDEDLRRAEFNKAFVLMQYFGYLRRNPDGAPNSNFDGYFFWLGKLEDNAGDFRRAEMVRAFIESIEYGERFGH